MEIKMGYIDKAKLVKNLIGHKIVQYFLGTKHTTILSTPYGQMRGLQRKTLYDEETYYAFEGIPYAKPPLGELRFREPQPVEAWQGIRDCTYTRNKPIQVHCVLRWVEGSEDCLYLNIYAKTLRSEKPLPVIVWVFGGGFQVGEATRDIHSPDYFMKKDIILVTMNYRMGALGFLCLSDPDLNVPGNAGIKDQILALRWVRDNIAYFNGDPKNITLIGLSAGASIAQILLSTEQARGLFHKVILMSGSSMCCWANEPNHNWSYRLAVYLGYSGQNNEKEILRFLLSISANKLGNCSNVMKLEEKFGHILFPFGPTIEPYITSNCVICRPHEETLSKAWGNELPMIIGGVSFEGLFSYQFLDEHKDYLLRDFPALIPREVRDASTPAQLNKHIQRLKLYCFEDASRDRMESKEWLRLISIKHFWHAMHRSILARLSYAPTTPTYLYRFDFDSPIYNFFRNVLCGRNAKGVSHADDLFYMFYGVLSFKLDQKSPEYQTIQRLIGMWTAFAATDNPNCVEIAPVTWETLQAKGYPLCLNIDRKIQIIELPEIKLLKLWDSFYKKLKLY